MNRRNTSQLVPAMIGAIRAMPRLEAMRTAERVTGALGGEPFTMTWFKDKVVFIGWQ